MTAEEDRALGEYYRVAAVRCSVRLIVIGFLIALACFWFGLVPEP